MNPYVGSRRRQERPSGRATPSLRDAPGDAPIQIDAVPKLMSRRMLEALEDRYGRKSTLITSQLPVSAWHGVIGDPTYADAILDRLVHNAHRIELSGDSLRQNLPRKA